MSDASLSCQTKLCSKFAAVGERASNVVILLRGWVRVGGGCRGLQSALLGFKTWAVDVYFILRFMY